MKTIFTIIGLAILAVIIFFVMGGDTADAPTDTATSTDDIATSTESDLEAAVGDGDYVIDTEASTVSWEAEKSFVDGYSDKGFIPVSTGTVSVSAGIVSNATVTLNTAEITATETSNTSVGVDRLTSHLRSEDFFATDEFPEAEFVITDVQAVHGSDTQYDVTGDLTIKGETNEITFPTIIGSINGELAITGTTIINRTEWGVRYGSPSFFNDLGDSAIADDVSVTINLVATQSTQAETTEAAATTTTN